MHPHPGNPFACNLNLYSALRVPVLRLGPHPQARRDSNTGMVSPWWCTSMALLILFYWVTSSDSADSSGPYSVKRDLYYKAQEQTEKTLTVATSSLSLLKDVMEKYKKNIDIKDLTENMKKLASFASIAPGIGTVISSVVNTVLIFIPQTDPVLDAVQKGFAEVNRKLDSLSIKVSNLATDVEWFNYVSIYSQDEVRILNAWRKFDEFFNKQSFNDINVLAELFTNYYEYTQTEASVANFYQYLTVRTTSLTENINHLLIKKFKCDLNQIIKYNMYFSTLLWKGMVLNEVYWKLIGFNTTGKEAEHAQMFKNVYEAQWAVVESCKDSVSYVTDDVERIAKELPGDKIAIAKKLKTTLDEKYSWYNWVVLVYEKSNEDRKYIYTYGMIKFRVDDKIIVAVDYTRKSDEGRENGYHGNTCEKKMTVAVPQTVSPLPVVATTKARLKSIESILEVIMKRCYG
ncbi:hypothetical protein NFI96_003680 [Prochilodus magdalenae]|nr:hypothetical protein NFI96_003680 [Prochilodus magdalenae]